ncbi:FecR domain-containing protein [Pseudomonas sp. ABC1]|uniref:FecR domain-containing protein n=1 Tax=Pseudomonas sp. ABC1 TaxID=2748080 RepID=UPI0015C3DC84|nr:FecR domain-containing protein [Pseudomonas sp. ABC1]QLF93616.1 FecR domain-containing protein [Pseudomonas sp. ABC1]
MTTPHYRHLKQAADWYAQLSDDSVDDAQRNAWRHWLEEDPAHRQAWSVVEKVGARFEPFREEPHREPAYDALRTMDSVQTSRRRALLSISVLAVAGLGGWRALRDTPLAERLTALTTEYATGTGERRELSLPDGSRAWLNTLSALDTHYGPRQRLLRLHSGELLLEASGDPRGPLRVTTRHGEVSGANATFGLCHQSDGLCVSVFAGSVELATTGGRARLEQGQQSTLSAHGALGPLQPVEAARRSWSQGVYIAEGVSLQRFVEELGRHRHGYLGCSPEVAALRVVGSFPLTDTERALDMLPKALPVRIQRILPWWVTIETA